MNNIQQHYRYRWDSKSWAWTDTLRTGEYYYVDGVSGSPFDLANRVILVEIDNGRRYRHAQKRAIQIRDDLIHYYGNAWNTSLPFYHNIQYNPALSSTDLDEGSETMHSYWAVKWSQYLLEDVTFLMKDKYEGSDGDHTQRAFWFAVNPGVWDQVFMQGTIDPSDDLLQAINFYKTHSQKLVDYWTAKGLLDLSKHRVIPEPQGPYSAGQIPIPPSLKHKAGKTDPALMQLHTRLNTLEGRLRDARHEANTQHLLEQVLERLDNA